MRTTLTLDDDVAVLLKQVIESRKARFKAVVNQALREGLTRMKRPRGRKPAPYKTPQYDLGRCLVGSLDEVAEVLSVAEGERYR